VSFRRAKRPGAILALTQGNAEANPAVSNNANKMLTSKRVRSDFVMIFILCLLSPYFVRGCSRNTKQRYRQLHYLEVIKTAAQTKIWVRISGGKPAHGIVLSVNRQSAINKIGFIHLVHKYSVHLGRRKLCCQFWDFSHPHALLSPGLRFDQNKAANAIIGSVTKFDARGCYGKPSTAWQK
jgi:hypothetical protein